MKQTYEVTCTPKQSPDSQPSENRWVATFNANGCTYRGIVYAPSFMVAMTRFNEAVAKDGLTDTVTLVGLELSVGIWKLRHVLEWIEPTTQ